MLVSFLCFDAIRAVDYRGHSLALQRGIERRVDAIASTRHGNASSLSLLTNSVHEITRGRRHPAVGRGHHWLELRFLGGGGRDEPLLRHLLQDQIATVARFVWMRDGIVNRLRLGQPRENRSL